MKELELPPPEILAREAEKEAPKRVLEDYIETIHALRLKNFTFREIAEWFTKRGFQADHNSVWRAYSKNDPIEGIEEANRDEEVEKLESFQTAIESGAKIQVTSKSGDGPVEKKIMQTSLLKKDRQRRKRKALAKQAGK